MNLPLFIGTLGVPELVIILIICILLFGAKRVPQLLKGVGESVREFKGALRSSNEAVDETFEGLEDLELDSMNRRQRRKFLKKKEASR